MFTSQLCHTNVIIFSITAEQFNFFSSVSNATVETEENFMEVRNVFFLPMYSIYM